MPPSDVLRTSPSSSERNQKQILFRMLKEVVRFGVVIGVILLGFAMAMFALFGGTAPGMGDEDGSTSSGNSADEENTTGILSVNPFGPR